MSGHISNGIDYHLEAEADKFLHADRMKARVTDRKQQGTVYDILSPEQLKLRAQKEVLTPNIGTVVNHGVYRREYNPLFGRRPKRRSDPYDKPEYDARIPTTTTPYSQLGWELYSPRDPAGVVLPRDGYYWHLDRYQRSRIRSLMRRVASDPKAKHVVRHYLADHYGVPTWVISRCLHKRF